MAKIAGDRSKKRSIYRNGRKGRNGTKGFHRRGRRWRNGAEEPQPNDHGDSQFLRVSVAGVASDVGDVVR